MMHHVHNDNKVLNSVGFTGAVFRFRLGVPAWRKKVSSISCFCSLRVRLCDAGLTYTPVGVGSVESNNSVKSCVMLSCFCLVPYAALPVSM